MPYHRKLVAAFADTELVLGLDLLEQVRFQHRELPELESCLVETSIGVVSMPPARGFQFENSLPYYRLRKDDSEQIGLVDQG